MVRVVYGQLQELDRTGTPMRTPAFAESVLALLSRRPIAQAALDVSGVRLTGHASHSPAGTVASAVVRA